MKLIYKYVMSPKFSLPKEAKVLHVGMQGECAYIWAEVEARESASLLQDGYEIFPTGGEPRGTHVGTYQSGPYVWHVYRLP